MLSKVFRPYLASNARLYSNLLSTHKEFLTYVKSDGTGEIELVLHPENIAEIVISNPSKRNAISGRMMYQLAEVVDALVEGDRKKASGRPMGLIITGKGKEAFCSGADLSLAKNLLTTPALGAKMSLFMVDALTRMRNASVVSVCAINGPALGGGAELSTVGDFRILDKNSYCCFVHAQKGVTPGWGGAYRLVSIVGRSNALKLLGTCKRITSVEAVQLGFAEDISAYDSSLSLIEIARDFLRPFTTGVPSIASKDKVEKMYPEAISAIKRAIVAADTLPWNLAKDVELEVFQSRWASSDNNEAFKRSKH